MIYFYASEVDVKVKVVLGLGEFETFNIFCPKGRLLSSAKMASVPMGMHAAYKMRDRINGGAPKESGHERIFSSFQSTNKTTAMDHFNQPAQYNGKLMNSIWGMYNRYSVHNIKSHIAYDKA